MDRKDICDDEIVNQEIPRRFLRRRGLITIFAASAVHI